ncbi:kazal-type serine peptidase inhibitor domain 2 [Brachyhypopomus gauderio]|uniref:kazal-type serine peptidase inhibitor domain 2 n=1 Tax=Brachyhypopomus gauderio TaxID=698409 RepID=UPI0040410D2B
MEWPTAVLVLLLVSLSEPLPLEHLRHLDWQRGLRPGERCPAKCQAEQCPDARLLQSCASGLVRDPCGCCWECGNGEGQLCDPEPGTGRTFFGRCAQGLHCRVSRREAATKDKPRPVCVCAEQETVCGTDGKTYENVCRLQAAQRRTGERQKTGVEHLGPCKAKPIITYAPRDIIAPEGRDVLLSCEVSSYPLASIKWRKEGDSFFLTADSSNRAVQARGGPRRFELTGWLQIHRVGPDDTGVYTCTARNAFGEVSASARLLVMHSGSEGGLPKRTSKDHSSVNEALSEDDEDYEGQTSGHMYL